MNRKGALFHWIIFGIIGAIAVFFLVSVPGVGEAIKIKGEWQVDFLKKGYFAAEKEMALKEWSVKKEGWEVIKELGLAGGAEAETNCGEKEGYILWNKGEEWCLPKIEEALMKKMGVNVAGTELVKKGPEKEIVSTEGNYVKYVYDTSLRVDLDYDIVKEYDELRVEATDLIGKCRGEEELQDCVERKKENNWKFQNCGEDFAAKGRIVLFCVPSLVEYRFGLDFS